MSNLHVRDVPDAVHRTLALRAARRGMSLRQYTIEVLASHCELPTVDEWLAELDELAPADVSVSAADAVERAREEDDAGLVRDAGRP